MVTGSSVVASTDIQTLFREQHRKMVGVDMECYGLYYAAEQHGGSPVKTICIKSVSDLADRAKSDDFQAYCRLRNPPPDMTPPEKQALFAAASTAFRSLGFGIPDAARATTNTDHRTTLITSGEAGIHAGECHIFQVPIPAELRQQADEFDIRIDVTLSYVAQPRRTRRNLRRYLSTWVDWKASRLGEGLHDFRVRAMKDATNGNTPLPGTTLPWVLHDKPQDGLIHDFKRNSGTAQKDWAVVRSNSLPDLLLHRCGRPSGLESVSGRRSHPARTA